NQRFELGPPGTVYAAAKVTVAMRTATMDEFIIIAVFPFDPNCDPNRNRPIDFTSVFEGSRAFQQSLKL
ncbi:LOW QUALITY PROTEIN: hypothetical protein M8C21_019453, partial [Ambrosia artemisiifolia]